MTRVLTYVEIDVPPFVEETGGPDEETFRFAVPTSYLPFDIEAIPSIRDVSFTPAVVSLGEDLGQRATLRVTFDDHKHIFDTESYDSGSFWGKWRGRYGTRLRGRSLRIIRGTLGQTLGEMDTRHYIVDSMDGPDPQTGVYTINAKDIIKLADGDRAQAPSLNNGFLSSGISAGDTSATLAPVGIGNDEYPSSGFVTIGGNEICEFTRSGDSLSLTRGELGTTARSHDEEDRVQVALRWVAEDVADIIHELFTEYANISSDFINLSDWQDETSTHLQRVYTATVAEPTPVRDLVNELIEQAALAIWWDDSERLIRLQVLRAVTTEAESFTPENIVESSLRSREQPDKRIGEVWTYFGLLDPLEKFDDPDNYRSVVKTVDTDALADYGERKIKKIFSRWIPAFGRSVAQKLNEILLSRYRDPPRRFNFDIAPPPVVELGDGYRLQSWTFQDETGTAVDAPIQVTRLDPASDRHRVEAEEMLFDSPAEPGVREIIIDTSVNNFNLRTTHDTLYPEPEGGSDGEQVRCVVQGAAVVGSTGSIAFNVGSWPSGVDIEIVVRGRIQGRGGKGGNGGDSASSLAQVGDGGNGASGGTALFTREDVTLTFENGGQVWGGGGGGGGGGGSQVNSDGASGAGGGGGAGTSAGSGGSGPGWNSSPGSSGSATSGGSGGTTTSVTYGAAGGDGANPGGTGAAGQSGRQNDEDLTSLNNGGSGGSAGRAIDGDSFVTISGSGDVRGPTVN